MKERKRVCEEEVFSVGAKSPRWEKQEAINSAVKIDASLHMMRYYDMKRERVGLGFFFSR